MSITPLATIMIREIGSISDAERACFEAGIKFGTVYHQFAGTPVSPGSADALARAMESSVENQPHCVNVTVDVDVEAIASAMDESSADYVELTGRFFEAEVVVAVDGTEVVARMQLEDDYPLMQLVTIAE